MRSKFFLVVSICVRIYNNYVSKNLTVPFENLMLSVTCCLLNLSLSLNVSSVVCYVQQAVQTEYFLLFQIRHGGPPGPEIFSFEL